MRDAMNGCSLRVGLERRRQEEVVTKHCFIFLVSERIKNNYKFLSRDDIPCLVYNKIQKMYT